ncbi:DUF4340 domain-containing protein [Anaeromicropila herbilytica]|uniref:DUF4340 domain-containing protein n=1 Tax=Anaeromicropila herbilytica TaxID=2785025 RepID=A0A7R7EJB4_9FIRM|nr:DUF4340 domain-containing protein [Anaeromicropila herbilytica]BCN29818.1 hypothetical protein bsdtb5_11130 [Anaeromicropila herbilytica]
MAKKKKKNRSLLFLTLAMILTLVAYVAVVKINNQKESKKKETESTNLTLLNNKAEDITKIAYTNETGGLSLVKEKDVWVNEKDKSYPINQSNVSSMLSSVTSLTSDRLVGKDMNNLSEYGLDKPTVQITVTKKDGTSTKINVGSKLVTGEKYYVSLNDDKDVYTVDSAIYTNFAHTDKQMIAIENPPTITADYITKLSIDNKRADDFEVVYNEEKANDQTDYYKWTMTKPYPVKVSANTNALSKYFANYASLSFTECTEYNAKDLGKYGLDKPNSVIDIKYYDENTANADSSSSSNTSTSTDNTATSSDTSSSNDNKDTQKRTNHEYKLLIGNKDKDGNYYVKSSDSNTVYTMSSDTVNNMLKVKPLDYITKNVNLTSIYTVDKMVVKAGNETYTLSVKKSKKTDKDAKEQDQYTYYCDGKKVGESEFKATYSGFVGLTNEAEITKKVTDNTPAVSVTITTTDNKNKKVQVNFLPYDNNYYRINSNGSELFLTTKRTVEDFVTAVKKLAK